MGEPTPKAAEIRDYWTIARRSVNPNDLGPTGAATDPPQVWAFGDSPELADELLDLVLAGDKTATTSAVASYGPDELLPAEGDLSVLLDGRGTPRALIKTTTVVRTRFLDVTEAFASAEGEGDRTLASWRSGHEAYFQRELGDRYAANPEVLCETFVVLHPATDGR